MSMHREKAAPLPTRRLPSMSAHRERAALPRERAPLPTPPQSKPGLPLRFACRRIAPPQQLASTSRDMIQEKMPMPWSSSLECCGLRPCSCLWWCGDSVVVCSASSAASNMSQSAASYNSRSTTSKSAYWVTAGSPRPQKPHQPPHLAAQVWRSLEQVTLPLASAPSATGIAASKAKGVPTRLTCISLSPSQAPAIPHSTWLRLLLADWSSLDEKVQSCKSTRREPSPKCGMPTIRSFVHVVFSEPYIDQLSMMGRLM
mmetsp:Transcript_56498/g.145480  ORF Transcript_56498/g.145480 Transcript_56498/m.145480 type:complete len:258 (+) Transcript_56498:396-1169(+)